MLIYIYVFFVHALKKTSLFFFIMTKFMFVIRPNNTWETVPLAAATNFDDMIRHIAQFTKGDFVTAAPLDVQFVGHVNEFGIRLGLPQNVLGTRVLKALGMPTDHYFRNIGGLALGNVVITKAYDPTSDGPMTAEEASALSKLCEDITHAPDMKLPSNYRLSTLLYSEKSPYSV
jgi:hypothetical protein